MFEKFKIHQPRDTETFESPEIDTEKQDQDVRSSDEGVSPATSVKDMAVAAERESSTPDPNIVSKMIHWESIAAVAVEVTWDGDDDQANPKNWPRSQKWAATLVLSAFAFISPLSSSMVSPSLDQIGQEFRITNAVERQLVLSIFLLGYSFGPFVLSPASETWGRRSVIQYANLFYLIFNFVCGFAQSKIQLLVFRLLAGFGGSATLGIGGGVLRDIWRAEERGRGVSVYSLAPVLGPAIGPIAGGFISEYSTWRWGFWAVTIANVMVQIIGIFYLRESYAPKILADKAKRLRKETGNTNLRTEYDDAHETFSKRLHTRLTRPWRLLATQPIIQILALYQAYNYGLLYLFISTIPMLFRDRYHESLGIAGLNYIALALGSLIAAQICAPMNDKLYRVFKSHYEMQEGVPEYRIPLMVLGAVITPIGMFLYGWSAQYTIFWLVPDIGIALYALGSLICYQCIQVYLTDTYGLYAASAFAATTFLRSLAGFGFPLFAPYLFEGLGYGWAGSLLGFIAIGLGIPAPFMFWYLGARLRRMSAFATDV